MYADDLAILLDTHILRLFLEKSIAVKRFVNLFQAAVDRVVRFMRENGFTLSIPKTVFIPFHTNNLLKRKLHVRINDVCIFASKKVKYLRLEASDEMEQPASLFLVLYWILCPHLLLVSHAATDDAAVSTDDFYFIYFFTFLLLN